MVSKEEVREFFRLVKRARETCAGSNVKPIGLVEAKVRIALLDAFKLGFGNYEDQLKKVVKFLREADPEVYGDRLEPDNILCKVCNDLREKYPEWI